MAERRILIAAGGLLALGLVGAILTQGASWPAWVGVAVLAISLPAGAIGWTLAMRLTVGQWTGPIAEACVAMAGRAPLAAALFAPILLHPQLYPWFGQPQPTAFRAAWFNPVFFEGRTIAGLLALAAAGPIIALGRPISRTAACLGLIVFFLLGTALLTDWLASLDPHFNSSGFGLYGTAVQFASALALAILAGRPEETHRTGALLLTLMMMWGYFAFMQYFILWSGNLPAGIGWYHARQTGIWPWLMILVAACRLPVFAALLFRAVRHSRRWMIGLAAAVLLGSALEFAWLAMPGSQAGPVQGLLYAVSAAGAVALAWPPRAAIPDEGGLDRGQLHAAPPSSGMAARGGQARATAPAADTA